MARTKRRPQSSAAQNEQISKNKEVQKSNNKPANIKLKPKRKNTSKQTKIWIAFGILVLVVSLAVGMLLTRTDFALFQNKGKYTFKNLPIPDVNISRGIDRRSNLSLDEFIELYDAKWPVLVTDAMENWAALKKWNKQFFMANYGNEVVSFKGVSGKLQQRQGLAAPIGVFLQHIGESTPAQWSYAEDEVFLVRNPELRRDIDTPIYLKEDFFSLLPEDIRPWNAMILWGTKYSRSTLHIDPYNWTGTNAVLRGRKQWKLFPPGQDHLLYVPSGRKSGFPLDCPKYQSPVDTFDYDEIKYPKFKKAHAIEFVQKPGEMLFIPTGWFHQAYNREETLAISSQVWNSQNYLQVMEEIVKGGNLRVQDIPSDFDNLSAREQVEMLISMFPKHIIEHGKRVNKDIMDQLNNVAAKTQQTPH